MTPALIAEGLLNLAVKVEAWPEIAPAENDLQDVLCAIDRLFVEVCRLVVPSHRPPPLPDRARALFAQAAAAPHPDVDTALVLVKLAGQCLASANGIYVRESRARREKESPQ